MCVVWAELARGTIAFGGGILKDGAERTNQ